MLVATWIFLVLVHNSIFFKNFVRHTLTCFWIHPMPCLSDLLPFSLPLKVAKGAKGAPLDPRSIDRQSNTEQRAHFGFHGLALTLGVREPIHVHRNITLCSVRRGLRPLDMLRVIDSLCLSCYTVNSIVHVILFHSLFKNSSLYFLNVFPSFLYSNSVFSS